MITLPLSTVFIAGSVAMYIMLLSRNKSLSTRKLKMESSSGKDKIKRHVSLKQNKYEARYQRLVSTVNHQIEQDEAVLEDLDSDLNFLDEQEKAIEARFEIIQERNQLLEEQRDQQRAKQRKLKGDKRELKALEKKAFLRLEERAGIQHQTCRKDRISEICEHASVASQMNSQRELAKTEAYKDKKAKQLLQLGSQRYFDPSPADRLLSYVDMPRSGKKKDRLLASEGDLLREISELCAVDFKIENPDSDKIMLRNAPESYTKEIARMSFNRWIKSGTLTEKSFQQHLTRAQQEIELEAKRAGKAAAARLEIKGIHPECLFLVGKLLFRTSYTQNQWQHAIESAELCSIMAEELGLDPILARRATLLHDIGKVLWEETERVGSHAVSGAAFARAYGEPEEVVHPIAAHHQDEAPSTPLAYLVIAADTMSGARPGARRETSEAFSQHMEQLEGICSVFKGINSYMVIQGGREVRLIVDPRRYSDVEVAALSQELAEQIEDECTFPGQIKVLASRDIRISTYARAQKSRRLKS